MFKEQDRLLLAVSGGIDSMVMLHLCQQLPNELIVCHVNHGLRDNDSDIDEAFVRSFCENYSLPFYCKNIANELDNESGNMHQISRSLRYEFFEQIKGSENADYILTAHHQDDRIEGILHNLIRGTGLKGLQGISPERNLLRRPMLCFTKEAIIQYAEENQVSYREDKSNLLPKYNRNRIRHELIPLIEDILPNAKTRLDKTIENLQLDFQLLESLIANLKKQFTKEVDGQVYFAKDVILKMDQANAILFHLIQAYGFSRSQIDDLLEHPEQTGNQILSSDYLLSNEREYFVLVKHEALSKIILLVEKTDKKIKLDSEDMSIQHLTMDQVSMNDHSLCMDEDMLEYPLTVRNWKAGDKFKPLGMDGKSQLVSKFLREKKVPAHSKANQKIIQSGNEICCILPIWVSENYKLTAQTKNIFCLDR